MVGRGKEGIWHGDLFNSIPTAVLDNVYINKRHTVFQKDNLSLIISISRTHYSLLHQFEAGFCMLHASICFSISSLSLLSSSSLAPFFLFPFPRSVCLRIFQEKQYLVTQMETQKLALTYTWLIKRMRKFIVLVLEFGRRKRIHEAKKKERRDILRMYLSKYICMYQL